VLPVRGGLRRWPQLARLRTRRRHCSEQFIFEADTLDLISHWSPSMHEVSSLERVSYQVVHFVLGRVSTCGIKIHGKLPVRLSDTSDMRRSLYRLW
jgi:hypothetical protein